MKESRAKFSFLPSGLSPSAPEYGSLEPSPAQPPDSPRRVAGSPKKILGLTAGAGISPAPESFEGSYTTMGAFPQGSVSARSSLRLPLSARYALRAPLVSTLRPFGPRLSAFQLFLSLRS